MSKTSQHTTPPMVDFGPLVAFWTQQAEFALQVNVGLMKAAMAPWQAFGWTVPFEADEKPAPVKPAAKPVAKAAKPAVKAKPAAPAMTAAPAEAPKPAKVAPKPAANMATTTAAKATKPAAKPRGPAKPAGLSAPRAGGADSLVAIKGLGPKLEAALNELGIYHFDQIAGWSADEIAWADANVGTIKGRASRDDWKGQAAALARGDEA